jgi:hypothetical protein
LGVISGDSELYIKIVEPIGHKAKEHNEEFLAQYELIVDEFTKLFRRHFSDESNRIQWDLITKLACEAPQSKSVQKSLKKL